MKKFCLLLYVVFSSANIYSQTYTISFIATGAVSALDSISVDNLTQMTSLTLYSGDILQLIISSDINEILAKDRKIEVYPNPIQDQTELLFKAKYSGSVEISIFDISGKEVLQIEDKLLKGTHKYLLSGLKRGIYLLNIRGDNYFYNSKLISQNITADEPKIKYSGIKNIELNNKKYKSQKATLTMSYTTGDILRFSGFSGIYSDVITIIPTASCSISFTFGISGNVIDIDGNIYDTIHIGNQVWLKQNLKAIHYDNGDAIPNIINNTAWSVLTQGGYCDYNNNDNISIIYGRLYNNYAVTDSRNLCPSGWHIPSDAEWTTLTNYLGGEAISGGKLKETGLTHWNAPNTGATNETGFTALPGGHRNYTGSYGLFGTDCYFWTSTQLNNNYDAWYRFIVNDNATVFRGSDSKVMGGYVRCIKN